MHSVEVTPGSMVIWFSAGDGATLFTGFEGSGDSINWRCEVMSVFFLIVLIVLFLSPLRRPFFHHWRFTVPATVGFIIGFGVGVFAARMARLPDAAAGLVGLVVAIGLACSLGGAFKGWCDRILGPRQQQQQYPRQQRRE